MLVAIKKKRGFTGLQINQEVQTLWTFPHYSQLWIQAFRNDGTMWECVQMGNTVCRAFVGHCKLCFSENLPCAVWTYCMIYGQALASWNLKNLSPLLEKYLKTAISVAECVPFKARMCTRFLEIMGTHVASSVLRFEPRQLSRVNGLMPVFEMRYELYSV